jgi:cystathionine beta-lyase/cystathionine gamma-synthase
VWAPETMNESGPLYGTPGEHIAPVGPMAHPLQRASTFGSASAEDVRALGAGERSGDFYQRLGHYNARVFEGLAAARDGADGAVSFASGMAAMSAAILTHAGAGDRVLVAEEIYGGTAALAGHDLPRFGIEVARFSALDPASLEGRLAAGGKLVVFESPINPTLRVADIRLLADMARSRGALVVFDGTFAPSPIQRPLALGADLVVHSATKFYGGHSDVLAGVVTGRHALLRPIEEFRRRSGGLLAPDPAWLLCRSWPTLDLRLQAQQDAAQQVAEGLVAMQSDGAVLSVGYPGLADHPDRAIVEKQMQGGGCLVSFEVAGGLEGARAVYDRLRLCARAASLGGVETLASLPAFTTHAPLSAEQRRRAGIPDGLIRIAVGLEGAEQILADIRQALPPMSPP